MTKSEVKHQIKEAVNKSPPLKSYLESKHIYGNYVSEMTNIFYNASKSQYWPDASLIAKIQQTIFGREPLCFCHNLKKYDVSSYIIEDIYHN